MKLVTNENHIISERTTCRICGSSDLRQVIDLNHQYIASIFVEGEVPSFLLKPYPLEVVRCTASNGCGLVQLKHTISPNVLYANYGYRSGTNEIMRANLRGIVAEIEQMVNLKTGDIVLDIGCNDGTLLEAYDTLGLDRLGFDPAINVLKIAQEKDLDVVDEFFTYPSFIKVFPNRKARVVTSIAMFYDLEAPNQFVADVAALLEDDGVWVIELSYLPTMLQRNSFDTICHEHLEYYTLRTIEWILKQHQLVIHKLEFNNINGGSFRLFIRKSEFGVPSKEVQAFLQKVREEEESLGLHTDRPYIAFRNSVEKIRDDLLRLVTEINSNGKSIYIYGASTKGNTILQFCGIDKTMIIKAADRNPEKWGQRTLGTDIPIASEEEVRAEHPDYFLVLPWHFFNGFINREQEFLKRGGKFILPLPEVRVVGIEG